MSFLGPCLEVESDELPLLLGHGVESINQVSTERDCRLREADWLKASKKKGVEKFPNFPETYRLIGHG